MNSHDLGTSLPLATSTWDEAEYTALQDVIASDRFTMGPKVAEFESQFAQHFGSNYAVMVNSGSSANLLAIAAAVLNPEIDLNPGDEVLVPAVSWATTYYPLQQYGLKMRFVDIDHDTLNIDIQKVRESISPSTKGIFAVNLLGNPVDYEALGSIADEHGLLLLEDNCESLGAVLDGKAAGTFGYMGTFSSFFSHHISTMEGGIILTDDKRTFQMLKSLRSHGWTRDLPQENFVYDKTGSDFDDLFRFVLPGYNLRPVEMSGALGIEQLKKVDAIVNGRRANARYFQKMLADVDGIRIQKETGQSSWFGFSLVLEDSLTGKRAQLVEALSEAGIESRPIVAGNFTKNPVMKYLDTAPIPPLPAADHIHENGLFVGNHHFPIEGSLDRLAEVVSDFS